MYGHRALCSGARCVHQTAYRPPISVYCRKIAISDTNWDCHRVSKAARSKSTAFRPEISAVSSSRRIPGRFARFSGTSRMFFASARRYGPRNPVQRQRQYQSKTLRRALSKPRAIAFHGAGQSGAGCSKKIDLSLCRRWSCRFRPASAYRNIGQ